MNDLIGVLGVAELRKLQDTSREILRLAKEHGREDPNPYSTDSARSLWRHGYSGQPWETVNPAFSGQVGSLNWRQYVCGLLCREAQAEEQTPAELEAPRIG